MIIEKNNSDTDRTDFAEMDLRMLVLCEGRERTLDDYAALAAESGLTVTRTRTTGMGQMCIEFVRTPTG